MFETVDHIGFMVRDLDAAIALYSSAFDVREWERLEMPERHMLVAVTRVGEMLLEFIAPSSEQAAFAKFLAERGPGMHHVAYRVDDLSAALAQVRARGIQLIDEEPRPGMHGTLVAFLHPKSTQGTLVELVQHINPPSGSQTTPDKRGVGFEKSKPLPAPLDS
jgi:methylmalonyl-CoA/ethylmalonyl-CoA epimerase